MSTPGTTHVFWYRWRRIMEGLQHEERLGGPYMMKAPEGAYLYWNGVWLERRQNIKGGSLVNVTIKPEEVPREIRALCLLLIN